MKLVSLIAAAWLAASTGVHAAPPPPPEAAMASGPAQAAAPQSEGEVRKLDRAQGKVTLRHGPLANLDMPPMTMVFKAADPRMLDGLKEGDRVRFTAVRADVGFAVTAIQPVP